MGIYFYEQIAMVYKQLFIESEAMAAAAAAEVAAVN